MDRTPRIRLARGVACGALLAAALAGLGEAQEQVEFELPRLSAEAPVGDRVQRAAFEQTALEQGGFDPELVAPPYGEYAGAPVTLAGWGNQASIGYDDGFVLVSQRPVDMREDQSPYVLRINGWGQFRHTASSYEQQAEDLNQFQLKRARLIFSGRALSPDLQYFVQFDGRSSSGDDTRLLDYFMTYDVAHHLWDSEPGAFGFKAGKYKMPFSMARYLSGRTFQFTDRSMASTYFDVNRSLAVGLYGRLDRLSIPIGWEAALFNGLVTGGAETGSSGALDNNFAFSGRLMAYPVGEWGSGALSDFEWHESLAMRVGAGVANSTINQIGRTEFQSVLVVDSGQPLSTLLPPDVSQYTVNLWALDASFKLRGWSMTGEYYFRNIDDFQGGSVPDLFDHGFWLQLGKFVFPERLELLARWSRVVGTSGSLGLADESSDEIAAGVAWYARGEQAKLVFDATHLNGAPINSAALDIAPGDAGWLFRTQVQFAF